MRFCATPELFVSPVPLMVRAAEGIAVIVKGLAPGLKAIALSSVLAENEMLVVLEASSVPVSKGPLGTVAGVQLAAVFQSPLVGSRSQVALPAGAFWKGAEVNNAARKTAEMTGNVLIVKSSQNSSAMSRNTDPNVRNSGGREACIVTANI